MDLPSELLAEVLCEWLDLISVVQLDSALCNKRSRCALLTLFSSHHCVFANSVNLEDELVVKWLRSRNLQVSTLRMGEIFPELAKYVRSHSRSVHHVDCLTSEAMSTAAIYIRNLHSLAYRYSTIVPALSDVLSQNENLQELKLENLSGIDFNLEYFNELSLPHLRLLSFKRSPCDDKLLGMIVRATKVLQEIDVGWCESVTDAGVLAVAQHCPRLCCLVLCGLPISDGALAQLAHLCPRIEHLYLGSNSSVTDFGVRIVAEYSKDLTLICISNCALLTDVSVEHLTQFRASTLQALNALGLPTVRVDVLVKLLQKCLHLHSVSLNCDVGAYITDIIPHMSNLRTLVTYSLLSDNALCMLAQHCKKLQQLGIFSSCTYLAPEPATPDGIPDTHFQPEPSPAAPTFSNTPAEARVMHCTNQSAHLSDCLYTETGLLALLDGLPLLKVLGVQEEEILQGLLTPLAQRLWQRLHPRVSFVNSAENFAVDTL